MKARIEKLKEVLSAVGVEGEVAVRSPGRVNLIGEHTDYNDGFVLPAAVNRDILMVACESDIVRVHSENMMSEISFELDNIERKKDWGDYIRGVAYFMGKRWKLRGFIGAIHSTIPIGAGLSSSAALEVLAATAFERFSNLTVDPIEIIKICRMAENEFVGVSCGIMDQFASKLGRDESALFLDCRSLKYEYVPIPKELAIAVVYTGVKRELASSKYNERRRECEEAARRLGKNALRDVTPEEFERRKDELNDTLKKRARHVIYENQRVIETRDALRDGDLERVRKLMGESHESLKKDYEVSCFELDAAVEIASRVDGVYGARMTGAGFGGCTVNLVEERHLLEFLHVMEREYVIRTGRKCEIYVCAATNGAEVVKDLS